MSRARELARLGNTNAISIDTSNNVGLGTTTSIQYKLDVVGDANFVGVVTATSFGGDGSNLTGVAATDNINTNNIKVSGITTLGTQVTVEKGTSGGATANTDSALILDNNSHTYITFRTPADKEQGLLFGDNADNDVGAVIYDHSDNQLGFKANAIGIATLSSTGFHVAGIVTATSFEGDGSSLSGVAATDYVVSNSLKVLGVSTFVGNAQLTATTASTSSATGALVVSGGVGIAGSLHVGENVSVGGTLTYEDVTNIDSVGLVTARTGVRVTAGGIIVTAGVSTFNNDIVATATTAISVTAADESSDTSCNVLFATAATGNVAPKTGTNLTFNSANGTLTATSFSGDGANLTNVSATASISTTASTASGIVSTLTLAKQDHKVTVSGISTFTCSGGTEGQSHTLRIVNSGITTVGFSSYFLFPSGSSPTLPTADGSVSLISFTVHRVGTPGIATQLLAGASLNLS
tara:strand:+ start:314 stop:1711 length:1398 start_codon:yes stop_codon:yes gene_type:complete